MNGLARVIQASIGVAWYDIHIKTTKRYFRLVLFIYMLNKVVLNELH